MTGAGGGAGARDEIPEFEMENVQWQPGEPGRAGSKRIRDSRSVLDSYGFYGLTTAEKKPMLQPHDFDKSIYKAGSGNHLHMNSGGASKIGARYLHGTHGLETPDLNALRKKTAFLTLIADAKAKAKKGSAELPTQTRAIYTK